MEYSDGLAEKTIYNNITFRAKLEARWAVFFDTLGIKWRYEPFHSDIDFYGGLTGYKIDFFLEDIKVFVEIKPSEWSDMPFGAKEKARGWAKEYGDVLILLGPPSIVKSKSRKHYLISYSNELNRHFTQSKMWWCRCPRCGKVEISPEGGVPVDCRKSCFSKGPDTDLFGEYLDEPAGHLDNKIKNACRIANESFCG